MTRSLATAGDALGIKVNLIAPAAMTRMAGQPAEPAGAAPMAPELVAPIVAFLAHEDCPVSGEIYAAGAGRFARMFIASTPGYLHVDGDTDDRGHRAELGDDQRRVGLLRPDRPHGLVGDVHGAPATQTDRSRSSRLRTLPEGFLGSASMSTTSFGTLNRASWRRQCSTSTSDVVGRILAHARRTRPGPRPIGRPDARRRQPRRPPRARRAPARSRSWRCSHRPTRSCP